MSAIASEAPVRAPCSAYLAPPWMMPCDFTLCPPPRLPRSTNRVENPWLRRRALSQRPAIPPPTIRTSVLRDWDMNGPRRKTGAQYNPQARAAGAESVAGHPGERLDHHHAADDHGH